MILAIIRMQGNSALSSDTPIQFRDLDIRQPTNDSAGRGWERSSSTGCQLHTERHPKGEGRYGVSRAVPVHPRARSLLNRYLEMRDEEISRRSPTNEALFPALSDKDDGYLSTNGIEILKQMVEDDVGARFDLRACRRTFGQSCIDNNVPLDSVPLIMGHGSAKTTESYYCRKREEVALREMSDSWRSEIPQSAKTSLIENKEYLSGYA